MKIGLLLIFATLILPFSILTQNKSQKQYNEDFLKGYKEENSEGMKYYIKIIPGDQAVDPNMPKLNPEGDSQIELEDELFLQPPVNEYENPKPIYQVQPEIPKNIQKKIKVWVKCTIDTDGNVQQPKIIKSDNKSLNKYVLDAVKQWKFKPAKLKGRPVTTLIIIPFEFSPN